MFAAGAAAPAASRADVVASNVKATALWSLKPPVRTSGRVDTTGRGGGEVRAGMERVEAVATAAPAVPAVHLDAELEVVVDIGQAELRELIEEDVLEQLEDRDIGPRGCRLIMS